MFYNLWGCGSVPALAGSIGDRGSVGIIAVVRLWIGRCVCWTGRRVMGGVCPLRPFRLRIGSMISVRLYAISRGECVGFRAKGGRMSWRVGGAYIPVCPRRSLCFGMGRVSGSPMWVGRIVRCRVCVFLGMTSVFRMIFG